MKKISVLILVLLLAFTALGAAADGIDSTTKSLCQIEGHSLNVIEKDWCTRTECSVCKEVTLEFGLVDINGDGQEDIKDLIRLKRFLAETDVTASEAADVNCDGQKNSEDMAVLRKILLGIL